MGYYFKSQYRGDFYRRPRGDYYGARGDLWDDITGFASSTAKALGQGADYVKTAWGSLFPPSLGGPARAPELAAAGLGPSQVALTVPSPPQFKLSAPTTKAAAQTLAATYLKSGGNGGHRRMNVLNPKALRRSLRRANGFINFANSVLKVTKPGHHAIAFKKPTGRKKKMKARIG
jgi:hypothetical protein